MSDRLPLQPQDVDDVMRALRQCQAKSWANGKLVYAFGGSHGGFLTAHVTGQFPGR